MTSQGFALSVPADSRYRGIAGDVGYRFLEMQGAPIQDCEAFRAALVAGVNELAAGTANVELSFANDGANISVELRSNSRSKTLTFPVRATKR
jgi:hypothetical protein